MVKNREELMQVAQNNANQLKTHLRSAVKGFLNAQRVTAEELAYVLGISNDEMNNILRGNANVSVDTLSKLLVATDLVVEIKPIRNTPLGSYGPHMPRSGGYPGPNGIPVDENGNPLPPPPGFPRPDFMRGPGAHEYPRPQNREERVDDRQEIPMETTQPRDAHGRFTKKNAAPQNHRRATRPEQAPQPNPYFNMNDADLINIIRSNIWDGEIDVNRASHNQLAEFVTEKERIMRERQNGEAGHHNEPMANTEREATNEVSGGGDALNKFLTMLGNVAREAQNNPQLMETINRFMPK